ncbi:nitroreductase family protein [Paenibacillus doosanensis]|uniref:nitroreductase family protein n=1 Tax=Paenibacillus doosanensis TaxID=1229154 RepID=UPI0021800BBD|nr:nitroreductase family protein [Paenibacillus doosanensis]MCS7459096.1 nitroreductase family protein [Paenibacillus doosanensis]
MSSVEQKVVSAEETIRSRHSVRKYQPGVTIPEEELNEILTLASSAPSSWNLQHWRFLVVSEQANKERLLPITYNQQQTVDASVVVIVLGDLEANQIAATVYEKAASEIREMMIGQVNGAYASNPGLARDEAIRNASLAAMQLMLAAKAKGYDTVPMGGYDSNALVKELSIPERYVPVMIVPIGKAAAPGRPTDRLPLEHQVIRESF